MTASSAMPPLLLFISEIQIAHFPQRHTQSPVLHTSGSSFDVAHRLVCRFPAA
jgi:hypothetical protein